MHMTNSHTRIARYMITNNFKYWIKEFKECILMSITLLAFSLNLVLVRFFWSCLLNNQLDHSKWLLLILRKLYQRSLLIEQCFLTTVESNAPLRYILSHSFFHFILEKNERFRTEKNCHCTCLCRCGGLGRGGLGSRNCSCWTARTWASIVLNLSVIEPHDVRMI